MDERKVAIDESNEQLAAMESILNSLYFTIYVSDLTTNEILYANNALQSKCSGQSLTGKVCWEALENKANRCESCPIPYLLKRPGKDYRREVCDDRHLKIYDSIIPWKYGKLAHLRYVVDIADSLKRE